MSLMRTYRRALGLSQSAFAAQLNVPLETYRPWDAGRREPPPQLLTRARTLAGYPDETVLLPLPVLALMIGVHVRTLHAAARSGRLGVAYDTRTTFRRLRPRATLKHALDFRRHYYGTQRRPPATPVPLTWASVPEDYDVQLKALRRHLDISQAGFARLVGAAGKAVVYQWEARKRTPSPLFWQRVHELQGAIGHASGCRAESRRLPMGGAEALSIAGVLATNHRAPPASAGATGSGHAPLVVPPSQEAGPHQKVEQGQERADHGGHVGERGGVQHAVHTPPLALTDDPVRHHEFLRAGRGIKTPLGASRSGRGGPRRTGSAPMPTSDCDAMNSPIIITT